MVRIEEVPDKCWIPFVLSALGSAEVGPGDRLASGRLRRWSRQGDGHEHKCRGRTAQAQVKVRESPTSLEGEPNREGGPVHRPLAIFRQPAPPHASVCALCWVSTCHAYEVARRKSSPGPQQGLPPGQGTYNWVPGWAGGHPVGLEVGGLEDTEWGLFPLAFPGSLDGVELSSHESLVKQSWPQGLGSRGQPCNSPWQLCPSVHFHSREFSLFPPGLHLVLPFCNVKGRQEALGLRRSYRKSLLWAEWPTSMTKEEAVRAGDAASALEAVRLGWGTWTARVSY